MQWLIDIISANVIATIGIPPTFIDRGDEALYDFTLANFTRDGAWHTLDLSGIIPTTATGVSVVLQIQTNAVNSLIILASRITGGNSNQCGALTQVANILLRQDIVIPVGPNRTIAYLIVPAVWGTIDFGIRGWWL